jgi:hypothetical protein
VFQTLTKSASFRFAPWIPAFAGMTTHHGYLVFSKYALLFLSSQIDSGSRALTEASAAIMLLLKLRVVFTTSSVSASIPVLVRTPLDHLFR